MHANVTLRLILSSNAATLRMLALNSPASSSLSEPSRYASSAGSTVLAQVIGVPESWRELVDQVGVVSDLLPPTLRLPQLVNVRNAVDTKDVPGLALLREACPLLQHLHLGGLPPVEKDFLSGTVFECTALEMNLERISVMSSSASPGDYYY